MANPLTLELVTPDRSIFDGQVDEFTAPGEMGPFTILNNHAAIVSALVAGLFRYKVSGKDERLLIGGGFLEFHENKATVLASSAERLEDIDISRAERSRERAEERLQHPVDGTIDYDRARSSRDRAKARIAALKPIRG